MIASAVRELLIWLFVWIVPVGVAASLVYLFLTLPPRRNDRARLFLDILETGLRRGDSPERTIVAASETREPSLGVRFHLLAARVEEGLNFGQALAATPGALPAPVAEIVRIGANENTLAELFPAARTLLSETSSRLRGAMNYVVVLFFVLAPGGIVILPLLATYVWPRMETIYLEMMEGAAAPPSLASTIFQNTWLISGAQGVLIIAMLVVAIAYVWGEGALRLARRIAGPAPDWLLLKLPWRRRRAQRDFTAMLAVLLDAGLEESRALRMAGAATTNRILIHRAEAAASRLAQGQTLPHALAAIERGGEFHWRWANALRSGGGFFAALRGWHDWLNAKAFQQEQAAAHLITTSFVFANGVIVLLIVAAVFQLLIGILQQEILW